MRSSCARRALPPFGAFTMRCAPGRRRALAPGHAAAGVAGGAAAGARAGRPGRRVRAVRARRALAARVRGARPRGPAARAADRCAQPPGHHAGRCAAARCRVRAWSAAPMRARARRSRQKAGALLQPCTPAADTAVMQGVPAVLRPREARARAPVWCSAPELGARPASEAACGRARSGHAGGRDGRGAAERGGGRGARARGRAGRGAAGRLGSRAHPARRGRAAGHAGAAGPLRRRAGRPAGAPRARRSPAAVPALVQGLQVALRA